MAIEAATLLDWNDASLTRNIEDQLNLIKERILCLRDQLARNVSKPFSRLMRPSSRKYEMGIASLATSYPKLFCLCSKIRQLGHRITSLKTDLGVIVKEPKAQVKLLNKFYDTAFRPNNRQPISTLPIPSVTMGIPYFPLASSLKSSPLSTPHSAQAVTNCTLWLKWLVTIPASPWQIQQISCDSCRAG